MAAGEGVDHATGVRVRQRRRGGALLLSCRMRPPGRGTAGALSATHRAGAEAAVELIARSASAHTRRVYASALGQLAAWLDSRRLDDASLAAYLGYLHEAGV